MNNGFSMIETVITMTLSTFLLASIIGIVLFLQSAFLRVEEKSVKIKQVSDFFDIICTDVLNPDIYPHRPLEEYTFEETAITFFANGEQVEYIFEEGVFEINRDTFYETYNFVKEFSITYMDKDEFIVTDEEEQPHFCEMKFIMYDKKELILKMRL